MNTLGLSFSDVFHAPAYLFKLPGTALQLAVPQLLPRISPPATAPPAPITAGKMTTWTPADVQEAAARQRLMEQATGGGAGPGLQPAESDMLSPLLIGAAVIAAISGVLILGG